MTAARKIFLRPKHRKRSPWPLLILLSLGFIIAIHIISTSRSSQPIHQFPHSSHRPSFTKHHTTTTTCPPLSKDLVSSISHQHQHAHHKTIMLALVSSNQLHFALNWYLSSTETNMASFTLLGATDPIAAKQLASWSIPCFTFDTNNNDNNNINEQQQQQQKEQEEPVTIQWGDDRWRDLTWQKVFLATTALHWGYDLIISDVDVVWLRNPLLFFDKYSNADILIGHDGVGTQLDSSYQHRHYSDEDEDYDYYDDSNDSNTDSELDILEPNGSADMNINTGLYFIRSNNNTRLLLNAWTKSYEKYHKEYNDQTALYELLRTEYVPADTPECSLHHPEYHEREGTDSSTDDGTSDGTDNDGGGGLFCCFKGRVVMGVVPTFLFANGHSYAVSKKYKPWGVSQPYAVHWTWTYGGETGKMMRMKEMLQWRSDPDEYYLGITTTSTTTTNSMTKSPLPPPAVPTHPGTTSSNGFISLKLKMLDTSSLPDKYNAWGSNRNEEMIMYHLTQLQRQLEQIYLGLALAAATGRILILPRLTCYCEYIWHPGIRCRMPDAQDMKFPITCPADYVFELDVLREESGVEVREWSFMRNGRVPDEIRKSRITLRPRHSDNDNEEEVDTNGSSSSLQIKQQEGGEDEGAVVAEYPAGLYDQQLLPLLQDQHINDYKVWTIDFTSATRYWDVYKGYACPSKAEEMERRLENVVRRWCCRFKEAADKLGKTEFVDMKLVASPSRKLQPLYDNDRDHPYCRIDINNNIDDDAVTI